MRERSFINSFNDKMIIININSLLIILRSKFKARDCVLYTDNLNNFDTFATVAYVIFIKEKPSCSFL